MQLDDNRIQEIVQVVNAAGRAIRSVYDNSDFHVEFKEDKSPLTEADTLSHQILTDGLRRLFPDIPFISEESQSVPFTQRKTWKSFWLIDPLDGTKEFIKRNGEFTVNVALIHDNAPVFGVVGFPTLDCCYVGYRQKGAFKSTPDTAMRSITARKAHDGKIIVARSRSHADARDEKMLSCFKEIETITAGSALKFCYLAEGKADIYIRTGPTMEWDTAAGQCVAECAGALMRNLEGDMFTYNKESLKNTGFICAANRELLIKLQEARKL